MDTMTAPEQPQSTRWTSGRVDLRGGGMTALVLRMPDPRDPAFYAALAEKVCQAPNFFRHAPVVVDLVELADAPVFNIAEIGRRLRQHWLVPIGVQNGTDEQNQAALNAGFAVFAEGQPVAWRSSDDEPERPARSPAPDAGRNGAGASKMLTEPVRSGRQVYAQGGDLVVMAPVSAGAELLADGHIHVYGALRGRALAGVSGNERVRILCSSLEAELVSVAGLWLVRENIPEDLIGRPAQVFLEDDRLRVAPLP